MAKRQQVASRASISVAGTMTMSPSIDPNKSVPQADKCTVLSCIVTIQEVPLGIRSLSHT